MQYNKSNIETIKSYTNYVHTPFEGVHVDAFFETIKDCLNNYSLAQNSNDLYILNECLRRGLTAVISVKFPGPVNINALEWKLGNPEAGYAVSSIFRQALLTWLDQHHEEAKLILEKITSYKNSY